jgi:hypothetical protein
MNVLVLFDDAFNDFTYFNTKLSLYDISKVFILNSYENQNMLQFLNEQSNMKLFSLEYKDEINLYELDKVFIFTIHKDNQDEIIEREAHLFKSMDKDMIINHTSSRVTKRYVHFKDIKKKSISKMYQEMGIKKADKKLKKKTKKKSISTSGPSIMITLKEEKLS